MSVADAWERPPCPASAGPSFGSDRICGRVATDDVFGGGDDVFKRPSYILQPIPHCSRPLAPQLIHIIIDTLRHTHHRNREETRGGKPSRCAHDEGAPAKSAAPSARSP